VPAAGRWTGAPAAADSGSKAGEELGAPERSEIERRRDIVSEPRHRRIVSFLQEFSIPLVGGVVVALLAANLMPHWYEHAVHWKPFGALGALRDRDLLPGAE
jgi:hypothetical protein